MIRNLAVAGGRQVKNEDLTQYIQAFTIFENMFAALNYDTFVVHGITFTANGANFDISSGVIYYDGELCLFNGATNVSLPHRLTKQRVGINPRTFQDASVNDTAESVQVVADPVGLLQLNQTVNRADDRFFRVVSNNLRANIDGNNNGLGNVWKPLLSDRIENVRRIPKPTGTDRYLQIGSIPIADTQASHFLFSGIDANDGVFAYLKLKRTNLGGTDNAVIETFFLEAETAMADRPVFYTRRNDTLSVFEFWVKSPTNLASGEFTDGIATLVSEDFTDAENGFTFLDTFNWQTTVPTNLVASVGLYYITNDELDARLLSLEFDSGWMDAIVGPDGNSSFTQIECRQVGKVVTITGRFLADTDTAGSAHVATIPVGVGVSSVVVRAAATVASATSDDATIVIAPPNNRNIMATTLATPSGIYSFSVTYFVD